LTQEPQRQLQLDLAEGQRVEGIIVETFGNDDRGVLFGDFMTPKYRLHRGREIAFYVN
jgi:hypothetical protein